jgi:hypothetical protein
MTHYIDFGGKPVFDEATVDAAIIGFIKQQPSINGKIVFKEVLKEDNISLNFENYIKTNSTLYPSKTLSEDTWSFDNSEWLSIIEKINSKGVPLSKWDITINFGIKTGYNEAFVIDEIKKIELIKADPKSAEIIKPLFRGRDVQKYIADGVVNWLIYVPWHFPLHLDNKILGASKKAEELFKKNYPIIYDWLTCHKIGLSKRNKAETGVRYEWYAMQRFGSNYWQDFEKPKLVWKRIGSILRFCYDESGAYCLDSTCIATGSKVKFLSAVLNSKLCNRELFRLSPKTGTGDLIISVQALSPLKVPMPSDKQEKEICTLLDKIIESKKQNPSLDTSNLENQIDRLVYQLYGLTEEEIKIVENA